ncbi:hypothetical protein GGR57DRAFT_496269 [Xylariaceae sp. FL1272]|nr:hypothetical protein GGR57DRAFT_496269 [Xylariaceae sp. FL1272]
MFAVVASPIEGPAKESFGDIDIFVTWVDQSIDLQSNTQRIWAEICQLIEAVDIKREQPAVASLAIAWPKALLPLDHEPNASETYIQVDVQICSTIEQLNFVLFKHSHGDIWNLLGSTIRPVGLTIDEVGLYVRMARIEDINKKASKILLTREPIEILNFLGLKSDGTQWQKPFDSEQELYEYATTCRFFWVSIGAVRPVTEGLDETDITEDKKKLKSNDRRRMTYRPVFRKWVEEFIPSLRTSTALSFPSEPQSRDLIRLQAFEKFPASKMQYDKVLCQWQLSNQRTRITNDIIKVNVPDELDPHRRGCCISALKKIILDGDESFAGIQVPLSCKDTITGLFDEEQIKSWVQTHWKHVSAAAWHKQQERAKASAKRK